MVRVTPWVRGAAVVAFLLLLAGAGSGAAAMEIADQAPASGGLLDSLPKFPGVMTIGRPD
jgi:hypothetical protein